MHFIPFGIFLSLCLCFFTVDFVLEIGIFHPQRSAYCVDGAVTYMLTLLCSYCHGNRKIFFSPLARLSNSLGLCLH